jgi:hypothetical protein
MISSSGHAARFADRFDTLDITYLQSLNCTAWYRGHSNTDFPILPSGVTISGPGSWTAKTLNNGRVSMNFNGTDNKIVMSNHSDLYPFGGDFTIMTWIFIPSNRTYLPIYCQDNGTIYAAFYLTADATDARIILLSDDTGGTRRFYYSHTVGSPYWPLNTWLYLVVLRTGTTCKMYINAVEKTVTVNSAWNSPANLGLNVELGHMTAGYSHSNLRDLIVLKGTALTADQISYFYNLTKIYLRNS